MVCHIGRSLELPQGRNERPRSSSSGESAQIAQSDIQLSMLIFPFPSVMTHSSTPRKRPTPKAGEAPKPAPTQEEIDEWLSPLNECIKEVKELVSRFHLLLSSGGIAHQRQRGNGMLTGSTTMLVLTSTARSEHRDLGQKLMRGGRQAAWPLELARGGESYLTLLVILFLARFISMTVCIFIRALGPDRVRIQVSVTFVEGLKTSGS